MKTRINQLRKNQKGVTIVEYIIVLAIVAAMAAALFSGDAGLRVALETMLTNAISTITGITGG